MMALFFDRFIVLNLIESPENVLSIYGAEKIEP